MNVLRCTIIDRQGGVSFIAHGDALPALTKACARNPQSVGELLDQAEPYYRGLRERVLNGLAVFDEHNVDGNFAAIRGTLGVCQPHEQPVFRTVDEATRETSLQPVKAGAVVFNLPDRRIIQIQNTYVEIGRQGRGRVFDGSRLTNEVFLYRLPKEWTLVP